MYARCATANYVENVRDLWTKTLFVSIHIMFLVGIKFVLGELVL